MSVARVFKEVSPYYGADLAELDHAQSADTMYLAHLGYAPAKLVRAAHTDWSFVTLTFGPTLAAPTGLAVVATLANDDTENAAVDAWAYSPSDSRYAVTAINDDTGQESRPTAAVTANNDLNLKRNFNTISWDAVTGAHRYRVYKANGTSEFGLIAQTESLTFRDDNYGPDFLIGPPVGENPFATDFPSTVEFFQQRLAWGRSNIRPNAVWFSRSGEYENMDVSRPLRDSDAVSFALVAGRVNAVNQLVPMGELLALTSDSVFSITGGPDGYISPTNIVTARQTGRGSSRLNPLVIDNVTFYVTGIGNSVRSLGYQFQSDDYNSNDMTIFSPHFFRGHNIVSWAYAAEPLSIIWAARDDGKLLAFTWQQEHQVWGWTLCETDGLVESVCSISENGEDRLYLAVRRGVTEGFAGELFIERMASAAWDDIDDACYLDCAVSFSFDTPTAVLTNLGHLAYPDVVVAIADGAVYAVDVANGTVTLPVPVLRATVGVPFTATIETMPLAIQTSKGWTIAKPQQGSKGVIKVVNSRGFKMGPTEDKLVEPRSRRYEPMGAAPDLFTGYAETILPAHISDGVSLVIQSPDPLPLMVTQAFYDPQVSE